MLAAAFLRMRELSFSPRSLQGTEWNRELLLVRSGRIIEAIGLLQESRPEILSPGSLVYLCLHTQVFIEYLREKKTLAALQSAQQTLARYKLSQIPTEAGNITVRKVMGLLCTVLPEDSSISYLLSQEQREVTCSVLQHALTNSN